MATIHDAYVSALLADAVYVNLSTGASGSELADTLQGRLTPQVAQYIGNKFTVKTQVREASSFDAAVWEDNTSGEVYVSTSNSRVRVNFCDHPVQLAN